MREYKLFFQISQINFFRVYNRWKAFTVWRRGLRLNKLSNASEKLKTNLFLFSAPLRRALFTVRETITPLAKMGMFNLHVPTGEAFTVEDFVKTQTMVHESLRSKFDELSNVVLTSVRSACDEVVDQFLKANNIAANHKMTFMERAALRAECRRLTRFLRLTDIMMTNFLKSMVLDSLIKLEQTAYCPYLEPKIEMSTIDVRGLGNTQNNSYNNIIILIF